MINLTDNAKKHLDNYLQQVRTCLKDCPTVDADEVEQNIKEHIESELQGSTEPVSFDTLDDVLKRLGSPQQWLPEEEISWWRKTILRLRTGPEDWRLAYISFGLLILGFVILPSFIVLIPASFIVARAALSEAADPHDLKAQKWLIYPPLIIVYLFLAFWLLAWPFMSLAILADGVESTKEVDLFPWNVNDPDLAFWPVALVFIVAGTGLWWLILGLVHKKKPALLQAVFRPFADWLKPRWIKWFLSITLLLVIICSTAGVLMIKYQGWYVYLKEAFG